MPKESLPKFEISEVQKNVLDTVSQHRIFYGHQSLGNMVANGLKAHIAKYPEIQLPVIRPHEVKDETQKGFIHTRISGFPDKIVDDYASILHTIPGQAIDFAIIRFNPLDHGGNMDSFMNDYDKVMRILRLKYPATRFVHITYPLFSPRPNWKTKIKKILGKTDFWQYDANIEINDFNDRLISRYGKNELIFDLARVESTLPNGERSVFKKDGQLYFQLYEKYTWDGSHFNELGQKVAGEQLLNFIFKMVNNLK